MEEFAPKKSKVVSIERGKDPRKIQRLQDAQKRAKQKTNEWFFDRAREAEKAGDGDLAEINYKKALEINPKDKSSLVNLGTIYLERKKEDDLKKAKDYFLEALRIDDDYSLAWYNLGSVCEELGQEKEALEFYQMAIQCDSPCVSAYFNLARLQTWSKDFFAAASNYKQYIEKTNDSNDSYSSAAAKEIEKLKMLIKG